MAAAPTDLAADCQLGEQLAGLLLHALSLAQLLQLFIQVGQAIPLPMRQVILRPDGAVVSETTQWHDIGTGFYAAPQLVGDRVTLELSVYDITKGRIRFRHKDTDSMPGGGPQRRTYRPGR